MLAIPLVVLVALATSVFSPPLELATTNFLIYTMAVLGLGMFWGNSGILSLGHVAFMALGAYIGAWLTIDPVIKESLLPGLPDFLRLNAVEFLPAVLIVIVAIAAIAAVTGTLILRLGGGASGTFVIASFGILVIVYIVLMTSKSITNGAQPVYGLSGVLSPWTALLGVLLSIALARFWRDSTQGLQLRASRDDELAARSMGVNVPLRRWTTWVLSAIPAGIAGMFLGEVLSAFSPAGFYLPMTFTVIAMILLGGFTTVSGAVIGAALVTILIQLLDGVQSGLSLGVVQLPAIVGVTQIGLSVVIIGTLFFRPEGVVGMREIDENLLQRLWKRRRTADATTDTVRSTATAASVDAPPARIDLVEPPVHGGADADTDAASGTPVGATASPRTRVSEPREGEGLKVTDLAKHFSGVRALDGVSLEIRPGEICGLIGPNGSGKTTLLNMMSGVYVPTSGTVTVDGIDMSNAATHKFARNGVGRTFQNIRLFSELTVAENVRVGATRGRAFAASGEADAHALLEELGLSEYAESIASTLPYGLQRRVEIARALALEPRYLLLDEPNAGLNEVEADELHDLLLEIRARYGVGILIIDHVLRVVMRLCERVAVLHEGHLITVGTPAEVQENQAVWEAYGGVKAPASTTINSDSKDN